jgi:hypothetical protein
MQFLKIGSLIVGLFVSSIAVSQDDIAVPATISTSTSTSTSTTTTGVASVLDDFHLAAAAGNWQKYFSLMSDDGVFLGSDVSERWPKAEFQNYASSSSGWTYVAQIRNIDFTPDGNTAWFDEVLLSANYGTSRGTGVLIKTDSGWKISQYHLVFPIPNALADKITDEIKAFEAAVN